jgi:SAM-dependent methyltransferase
MSALGNVRDRLMEHPWIYRAWQAPFADAKLRPFLRRLAGASPRRVLDIGCGPGTNAHVFADSAYVGVDINPDYIETAKARHPGRFVVGDVTDPSVLPDERFDCVFANSLMHHLDDEATDGLLARMAALTAPGGRVHILDLVLPERASPARALARMDRGHYARPVSSWRALVERHVTVELEQVYALGLPGLPLWWMIYFVGVPR